MGKGRGTVGGQGQEEALGNRAGNKDQTPYHLNKQLFSLNSTVIPRSWSTGPLQDIGVLHQLLLVVRSAPNRAEGAFLLSANHTDQAHHGGSQEEDQDRDEQPHQDHGYG